MSNGTGQAGERRAERRTPVGQSDERAERLVRDGHRELVITPEVEVPHVRELDLANDHRVTHNSCLVVVEQRSFEPPLRAKQRDARHKGHSCAEGHCALHGAR